MVDQFIVSSAVGGFLDRVAYPALRDEILKEILTIQPGDKEAIDVAIQDMERDPITWIGLITHRLRPDAEIFLFETSRRYQKDIM